MRNLKTFTEYQCISLFFFCFTQPCVTLRCALNIHVYLYLCFIQSCVYFHSLNVYDYLCFIQSYVNFHSLNFYDYLCFIQSYVNFPSLNVHDYLCFIQSCVYFPSLNVHDYLCFIQSCVNFPSLNVHDYLCFIQENVTLTGVTTVATNLIPPCPGKTFGTKEAAYSSCHVLTIHQRISTVNSIHYSCFLLIKNLQLSSR